MADMASDIKQLALHYQIFCAKLEYKMKGLTSVCNSLSAVTMGHNCGLFPIMKSYSCPFLNLHHMIRCSAPALQVLGLGCRLSIRSMRPYQQFTGTIVCQVNRNFVFTIAVTRRTAEALHCDNVSHLCRVSTAPGSSAAVLLAMEDLEHSQAPAPRASCFLNVLTSTSSSSRLVAADES